MNLVVVDVETTGSNPFKHDAIAVALVPINDTIPPKQFFVRHLEVQWNTFAFQNFNAFRGDWQANSVSPVLFCDEIESYIRSNFDCSPITLIGHNVGFDVAFLRKLAFQGGRDQLAGISHRAIDTHTLLYLLAFNGRIPADAVTSDGAFKCFNIEVAAEKRHTALGDALATKDLFIKLLRLLCTQAEFGAEPLLAMDSHAGRRLE